MVLNKSSLSGIVAFVTNFITDNPNLVLSPVVISLGCSTWAGTLVANVHQKYIAER